MRLVEYRILLPLTVEENYIGQLWSMAEVSRLNTGGGEGVEILKNEVFSFPDYTISNITDYLPEYENELAEHKKIHSSKSLSAIKNIFKRNSSYDNLNKNSTNNHKAIEKNDHTTHAEDSHHHKLSKHDSLNIEAATNGTTNGATADIYSSVPSAINEKNGVEANKQGQFTHKLYKIASKFPWFVQKLLPKGSTVLHEKSWNMYPAIKTHIKNEYMKENFHVRIDTVTKEFLNGVFDENIHNLTAEQLEKT